MFNRSMSDNVPKEYINRETTIINFLFEKFNTINRMKIEVLIHKSQTKPYRAATLSRERALVFRKKLEKRICNSVCHAMYSSEM